MYEPIRAPSSRKGSVHSTMAGTTHDFPHRTREEELDIQLAGHLAALLAVTDELRALAPSAERKADLDAAADRLAEQVTRLRGGLVRAVPSDEARDRSALHERAHTLAGRALVVAASRADTAVAILAAERMDAHAAAQEPRELTSR